MKFSTLVALRYLQTNRENRFFSWIAMLSVAGIAIGVAAMIVVLSVINGFENELRKRFLAANAQILAFRHPYGLLEYQRWEETIASDFKTDVKGMSPFVHNETMARKNSLLHSVTIRGIVPNEREKVQPLDDIVQPTEALKNLQDEIALKRSRKALPSQPSVILGKGLMRLLDVKLGDTIGFLSPDSEKLGEIRNYRIVGTYDSGLMHYDNKLAIMSLSAAQDFFKMGERVTGLEIGLFNPAASPRVAERMGEKYSLTIREWMSFNRPLFEAMQMERAVIGLIVALVAFVASFNILTTLFVSVSQKQQDISILKALGASNRQVMWLFVKQGTFIGVLGSTLGALMALVISVLIERYHFIDLPDLYLLATLPISYNPFVYLTVALGGIVICVVAGLYPAQVAARVSPTEGFRGNQAVA